LEPEGALEAQLALDVGEALPVRELIRIGVPDHVVVEGDAAPAREHRAARLQEMPLCGHRLLAAAGDLAFRFLLRALVEAAVEPVAVRAEDGRVPVPGARPGAGLRPVEAPRDVEP